MPTGFNFHEWQCWISSGYIRPKKILSTTNKFLSNDFLISLYIYTPCCLYTYIYKLKISVPAICYAPTVSCVNFRSQSFVFNVLISCHGRSEATKKLSLRMSWNYWNSSTRAPVIKITWFLAGRLYLNNEVFSCAMVLLIVFLSKTINFFNVNITYVYITEFTLAKPM